MNADAQESIEGQAKARATALLSKTAPALHAFAADTQPLRDALHLVAALGNINAIKASGRLLRRLDQFEPSITMIGQIKSGKTTLVNSLIGWPDLLPADVNPWTSVVTSLHLRPRELTPNTSAKFRFFENGEWDRLVAGGGRIGELADRAGANDELSKIKAQAEIMREKSKARLGRKFEMLLGSEHSYGYFDQELVERYVCLGDDADKDLGASKSQGRFADITKSADLAMQQAGYPINLCIRDTPGVNDTFMIREQITIKSIRDSRICVVVLSAHQALSATDLALIRLISNVKSREVIIFVNRIDELSDPGTQVPQIQKSIESTLEKHKGPKEVQLIFGSALWAQTAMASHVSALPKASQEALWNWAGVQNMQSANAEDPVDVLWQLSGLPQLLAAISDRIVESEGRELMSELAAATTNLLNHIRISDNLEAKTQVGETKLQISQTELNAGLAKIQGASEEELNQVLADLDSSFEDRLERAHQSFLNRATEALAKHLEIYGEQSAWTYDPQGLRVMLNSAYKLFGSKCQSAFVKSAEDATNAFRDLYVKALALPPDLFAPRTPPAPRIPPPVSLGQTIALDLGRNWWAGWWNRRRTYKAQAEDFRALIKAETDSLLHDLLFDQAKVVQHDMAAQLRVYLNDQTESLASIAKGSTEAAQIENLFGVQELGKRNEQLKTAVQAIERYTHDG